MPAKLYILNNNNNIWAVLVNLAHNTWHHKVKNLGHSNTLLFFFLKPLSRHSSNSTQCSGIPYLIFCTETSFHKIVPYVTLSVLINKTQLFVLQGPVMSVLVKFGDGITTLKKFTGIVSTSLQILVLMCYVWDNLAYFVNFDKSSWYFENTSQKLGQLHQTSVIISLKYFNNQLF